MIVFIAVRVTQRKWWKGLKQPRFPTVCYNTHRVYHSHSLLNSYLMQQHTQTFQHHRHHHHHLLATPAYSGISTNVSQNITPKKTFISELKLKRKKCLYHFFSYHFMLLCICTPNVTFIVYRRYLDNLPFGMTWWCWCWCCCNSHNKH